MSKTDIRLELLKPLDEMLWARLMRAHSIYGVLRLVPDPAQGQVLVTFDATRFSEEELVAELRRAGLPVSVGRPNASPNPA